MAKRNAHDSSVLPTATPRDVRPSLLGAAMMLIAGGLVVAGMWGGIVLGRRAETAGRHVGLFASERLLAAGDVVRLRRRGGDDDERFTVHYRYSARGTERTGATALRRSDSDNYAVGSPVGVWYLPSEPDASWLDGYEPRPEPEWPATVVPLACGGVAMTLIFLVRRQWNLLVNGRPALAAVTKVEKKKSDEGKYWLVHYEWTTLSGATRTGKYNHSKKLAPAIGDAVQIICDRDNTFRHSRYPMTFVRLADRR